jgi:hypothetical protein
LKRAVVLVVALLASVLAVGPAVQRLHGNPSGYFPRAPLGLYYDNLSLFSPENVTYRTTKISLVFTRVFMRTRGFSTPSFYSYSLDGGAKVDIYSVKAASRAVNTAQFRNLYPGEEYRAWFEFYPEFTEYTFEFNVTLPKLADGSHKLNVADRYGILGTVYFSVEISPPQVSIFLSDDSSYGRASLPMYFRIVEEASWISWVGYNLDGKGNMSISKDSLVQRVLNGNFLYCEGVFSLFGLSAGVHSVVVYGANLDGLTGVASCVFTVGEGGGLVPGSFTVSQEAGLASGNSTVDQEAASGELVSTLFSASTTVVAATVLASVAAVSFGLVAYFLRREKRRAA